jgi:hypothetical protein
MTARGRPTLLIKQATAAAAAAAPAHQDTEGPLVGFICIMTQNSVEEEKIRIRVCHGKKQTVKQQR